jgi:hypothetical protein
MQEMFE